ncbi:type 2 lanthipeptide synthetase LanM family protein [Lysinibacillus sp. NPDC094403]|uniref:type 2 lanthipeptide synthetase LanM family protein n=1 Tax=Lysinibacillus sp. NPDC094403 TaxID=3390581 RepID=UPI003D003410
MIINEREQIPKIDFQDVLNYWKKFFPELKDPNEFEDIIFKSTNKDIAVFKEEWEKESIRFALNKQKIDSFFNFNPDKDLSCILSSLKKEDFPFLNFFKPIFLNELNKYTENFDKLNFIYNKDSFYSDIFIHMYHIAFNVSYKTLIFEIDYEKEQGNLFGETSEERFQYYTNVKLENREYLKALYIEYESLTNLLFTIINNYLNFLFNMLHTTSQELKNISIALFDTECIGKLINVSLNMGDTHNGGKTVSILTFEGNKKVVYKPRSLAFDQKYSELLSWIENNKSEHLKDIKSAKVYTKDDHGWMEFIEHTSCNNIDQVKLFYIRSGQLLCLLYALNAKDFHSENLIASGEHPYLIDLETLLQPDFENKLREETVINTTQDFINKSVYSIFLLPSRMTINKNENNTKVVDFGGMAGSTKQQAPIKSSVIINKNSDEIRVITDYGLLDINDNNPRINEELIQSELFIDDIQCGFINMYRWIMDNKTCFTNKLRELYTNEKCRVVCKPTFIYSQLLTSSYHPDLLRNPIHREVYFSRIALSELKKGFEYFSYQEHRDLMNGDIPYFSVYVDKKVLVDSKNKIIPNFEFEHSTIETVITKIQQMNETDLNKQITLIDLSYMHTSINDEKQETNIEFKTFRDFSRVEKPTKSDFLNTAIKIGDRLINESIYNAESGDRTWFGLMVYGKNEVTSHVSSVDVDVYKGNSGISLFFAYLASITNLERFKQAAIETLSPSLKVLESINKHKEIPLNIGAFTGLSGILYTVYHVGNILEIEKFKNIALQHIDTTLEHLDNDTQIELLGGMAGALSVFISIYNVSDNEKIKNKLLKSCYCIFEKISKNTIEFNENSIFWGQVDTNGDGGYTGFAHGTSGIIASLGRFYKITKDKNISQLIKKALNFERELYSPVTKNWRTQISGDSDSIAWCHGATGILLSRSILINHGYFDEEITEEINIALETTLKKGFGNNITLCHGDLGSIGVLFYLATVLDDESLFEQCNETFNEIFNHHISQNWNKPSFRTASVYGLMIGLAGYGYSLLKYGHKAEMPEILWME